MAGSITVSSITLDSDNNFSIRSNTGATILSANGTGLITGIASGSAITNAQLTTPTVSGNAAFDTNTLFVDATNDRVGIGTSTPAYTFDVTTSTTVLGRFQSTHSTGGYLYFQASGTTPTATGYIGAASKLNSGGANTDFGMTAVTNLVFGTNDGTERMRIDSAGRVTMPAQPCFLATRTSGSMTTNGQTVVFNSVQFNTGSHYNSSNGRFTAPITGNYLFALSAITGNSDSNSYLSLYKNNSSYGIAIYAGGPSTYYKNFSSSFILNLAAGDYIELVVGTNTNLYAAGDGGNPRFSGCLLN